jgi:hypothetical protein
MRTRICRLSETWNPTSKILLRFNGYRNLKEPDDERDSAITDQKCLNKVFGEIRNVYPILFDGRNPQVREILIDSMAYNTGKSNRMGARKSFTPMGGRDTLQFKIPKAMPKGSSSPGIGKGTKKSNMLKGDRGSKMGGSMIGQTLKTITNLSEDGQEESSK